MLKKDLRSHYRDLRNSLSPSSLLNASLSISNRALQLPIWQFDFYHLFLPISEKKEVDTSFILSILHGKDKNIVLPKMEGNETLKHYLLTDATKLKKNKWNIPEPVNGVEVPLENLDVIFVPLLAFDKKGNRVGYGKGFYDRFMAQCRSNVIKIGLSLFEAEETIADCHEDDIALDHCVTPSKIYSFSKT